MDKYKVYLKIHDFSVDCKEISELLEITPDISWNKDDLFNEDRGLKRKFSTWQIKEEVISNKASFDVLFSKIWKRIKGKEAIFRKIIMNHSGEFSIVAYLEKENNLGFYIDNDLISKINNLGLSLDVDIYFVGKVSSIVTSSA